MATIINCSTTGSGRITFNNANPWSQGHDATDGQSTDEVMYVNASFLTDHYNLDRPVITFDTSTVSGNISSAKVVCYRYDTQEHFSNTDLTAICVVQTTPASSTVRGTANFDQFGTALFSSVNLADTTDNTEVNFALNAAGIAAINKSGYTNFGLRLKRDIDNSAPTNQNLICFDNASGVFASKPPRLEITIASGGGRTLDLTSKIW
jgi:hypothetical protein